jgi:hypothetical protein
LVRTVLALTGGSSGGSSSCRLGAAASPNLLVAATVALLPLCSRCLIHTVLALTGSSSGGGCSSKLGDPASQMPWGHVEMTVSVALRS